MKNYKLIFLTVLIGAVFSCTNPEDYRTPDLSSSCGELTATKEVQAITAATTSTLKKYADDDIIEAYVTSSDEGGNFYKSLSFVSADGNYGFSMPIDDYNLYTKYEPGKKVYVKLKDRYYVKDMGGSVSGTVIGSLYNNNTVLITSDDEVGRMSIAEYQNILTASCSGYKSQDDLAQPMTIAQAKNDQNLNKLIVIDKVQFTDASLGKKYFDASMNSSSFATATDHTIKDINNATLIVRVSSFSTFANNSTPSGSGKIYGVMTKYNSTYQFMIRTEKDVQFTEERLGEPEPEEPEEPEVPTNFLFNGADFENWTTFNASVNSFGLKSYAVQGVGTGAVTGNSFHLNGTPTANDYVFTISAAAHGTFPANPKKITFWVKGTSAKSLSLNIYRGTAGTAYDVFNVGTLGSTPVTLSKAALQTTGANAGSGTNAYTGAIDTGGQWVKITLDISDVQINTTTAGSLFALKVGSNSAYNLHVDNIEIQ